MKVLPRIKTINNYNVFNRKEAQHPLQVSRLFKQKTSISLNRHLNQHCSVETSIATKTPAGCLHTKSNQPGFSIILSSHSAVYGAIRYFQPDLPVEIRIILHNPLNPILIPEHAGVSTPGTVADGAFDLSADG